MNYVKKMFPGYIHVTYSFDEVLDIFFNQRNVGVNELKAPLVNFFYSVSSERLRIFRTNLSFNDLPFELFHSFPLFLLQILWNLLNISCFLLL